MLKVWTDKKDFENIEWSYLEYFYYYFGVQCKDSISFFAKERIKISNIKYFELVEDIKECDIIIPLHLTMVLYKKYNEKYKEYINLSKEYNKPILLNLSGDYPLEISFKNSIIIKNSLYLYELKNNEVAVPPTIEDIGKNHIKIKHKGDKANVSFVGFAEYPNNLTKLKTMCNILVLIIKSLVNKRITSKIRGLHYRIKIINLLKKSKSIDKNFVIRNHFSGSKKTVLEFNKQRIEYINNLASSDYVLCIKGDGNYSLRFYETLSMGKIPILVNTEKVLPLMDKIDYAKFCLIIDYKDIKNINEIITSFHNNITNEDFIEMQRLSREFFEKYLQVHKYYQIFFNEVLPKKIKDLGLKE